MTILFTASIQPKHQEKIMKQYPEQTFIFHESMQGVEADLPDADILVTYGSDVTAEHLQQAGKLKWIMVLSAGVDQMPLATIEQKGILLTNVRGIHKVQMSEYALSMLLQVYRQAKTLTANETKHVWDKTTRMSELFGQTMLVMGAGAIGQEVARLAKAFQMKTIGVSKSGTTRDYFDENYATSETLSILNQADVVVSILPDTPDTAYFYTMDHFQQMPNHAVFLNMGRGNAVTTDVILQAVQEGEIAHAVLDVQEEEPLPDDSPLWDEDKVTITPHVSGVSPQYVPRAMAVFSQNLEAYLQGNDLVNTINPSRGY